MYLNTSPGYVYRCTVAGAAAAAKWGYAGSSKGATGAQGAAGTNATTTAVATTSANGLMSAADKTKLNNTQSIKVIVQGKISSLTTSIGRYYIPYQTGCSKVLVEYLGKSAMDTAHSFTTYGSAYLTGMSNNMSERSAVTLFGAGNANPQLGVDTTGRPYFGGSIVNSNEYRATWYI